MKKKIYVETATCLNLFIHWYLIQIFTHLLYMECSRCCFKKTTTVWLNPCCRNHFRHYLGNLSNQRRHSMIDPLQKLLPNGWWLIHSSSILIRAARPQSVLSIRISHVKWRAHDMVYDTFASFDHVLWRLVRVFHTSEWPAWRRLTWEILTEHTLWGRAAQVGIDVYCKRHSQ